MILLFVSYTIFSSSSLSLVLRLIHASRPLSLRSLAQVGTIPENIGDLADLKVIDLSGNTLSGTIPESLSTISTMVDINFSGNKLTGPLPAYIYNQKVNVTYPIGTTLRSLDISYNSLTGDIPETWFGPAKLGPFPPPNNLQVVNLRYNQITGDIPRSISTAFKLDTLLLSYNKMSGNITDGLLDSWLGTRKYCDLSGNSWGTVDPKVSKTCNM